MAEAAVSLWPNGREWTTAVWQTTQ